MPHRCVHCSSVYEDGSQEILKGCSSCGSRFFFYLTQEKLDKIKQTNEEVLELTNTEKKQIEKDVRDIAGLKEDDDTPIVLDFESVKILRPGKYLIDVHNLFTKERPLIYKLEDGKYIIDIAANLKKKERA